MDLFSLEGRRALVTGSGDGIGSALASGLQVGGPVEIAAFDVTDPARCWTPSPRSRQSGP